MMIHYQFYKKQQRICYHCLHLYTKRYMTNNLIHALIMEADSFF